jgi:hypothetical protein
MTRKSTMKGKQSVHYRHLTDEGFETLIDLPKTASKLLYQVIQDTDKKDNCCQLNTKQLILKYKLNASNTYTNIRKLKAVNFLREVEDVGGVARLMVNPEWLSWQNRSLVRFTILMYSLGSHELTIKHLDLEHKCRGRIDIHTGEHFDWFRNGIERADLHHGLELNSPYEYSSTVQPTTSADAQKALSTQHTNSINSAALGIQITRSSGVSTFEEVYSYDEDSDYDDCNDYEDACHYQNNQPSIVSLKDIIVDMA